MKEKKVLDLYLIADECGVLSEQDSSIIVDNIDNLEKSYDEDELVVIYNHFLSHCKNHDVLMYLIKCVDKHRQKSSLSPIFDILLDKTNPTNLRVICAKVVGNFKIADSVTPLLYCLNDKHEPYQVRLACADSLGRVGDKYAVAPLIDIVKDEEEKSIYVRESAAVALGMLGDLRAIDPLLSILESKKGFIDKFTFLKERVIEVLGKFNFTNDRVLKALERSLSDESACIRINAIEALMESEHDKSYELIKNMLEDLDDEVKKNALIALYNMGGREILDEVLESSKYSDFLKEEAQNMIDEYESDSDEE